MQRSRLQSAALANSWEITNTFGGDPETGVSTGKHGPRKLLEDLLTALKSTNTVDRPNYVIMTRSDRIGRGRLVDTAYILREIYDLGVKIFTCDDGIINLDSPMDELIAMVKQAAASQENRNRQDKARAGHARRKARGLHDGNAPYGIVLINGKPQAQEPQASIVRKLFEMRAAGHGLLSIALYARAHATPKRLVNDRLKVLKWNKGTAQRMFECQTYRGTVIDERLFDSVANRNQFGMYPISNRGHWPLRGSITCSCGRRLSGRMNGETKWVMRYYVCTNHYGHIRNYRADEVEAAFVRFLDKVGHDHVDRPQAQSSLAYELRIKSQEIRRQIASVNQARDRTWELFESGLIQPEQIQARLETHDQNLARMNQQLEQAEDELSHASEIAHASEKAMDMISSISERWERMDYEDQAQIASSISTALGGIMLTEDSTSRSITLELRNPSQSDYFCVQMSTLWDRLSHLTA